jgi:hypothetical protein
VGVYVYPAIGGDAFARNFVIPLRSLHDAFAAPEAPGCERSQHVLVAVRRAVSSNRGGDYVSRTLSRRRRARPSPRMWMNASRTRSCGIIVAHDPADLTAALRRVARTRILETVRNRKTALTPNADPSIGFGHRRGELGPQRLVLAIATGTRADGERHAGMQTLGRNGRRQTARAGQRNNGPGTVDNQAGKQRRRKHGQ